MVEVWSHCSYQHSMLNLTSVYCVFYNSKLNIYGLVLFYYRRLILTKFNSAKCSANDETHSIFFKSLLLNFSMGDYQPIYYVFEAYITVFKILFIVSNLYNDETRPNNKIHKKTEFGRSLLDTESAACSHFFNPMR